MRFMHSDASESGDDGSKRDDDSDRPDRDAILARRKMLVATALVGIAIDGCERIRTPFTPCLEPQIVQPARAEDAGPAAPDADAPLVERSPDAETSVTDAAQPAVEDARVTDSGARPDAARRRPPEVNSRPRTCLRYAHPPQVCLMVALKQRPDDED